MFGGGPDRYLRVNEANDAGDTLGSRLDKALEALQQSGGYYESNVDIRRHLPESISFVPMTSRRMSATRIRTRRASPSYRPSRARIGSPTTYRRTGAVSPSSATITQVMSGKIGACVYAGAALLCIHGWHQRPENGIVYSIAHCRARLHYKLTTSTVGRECRIRPAMVELRREQLHQRDLSCKREPLRTNTICSEDADGRVEEVT